MRALLAAISLCLIVSPASAKRHHVKQSKTIVIVKTDEKLKRDMAELKRELAFFRELARGPSVLSTIGLEYLEPVIVPPVKTASLGPTNVVVETPRDLAMRHGIVINGMPPALKDVLRKIQATCGGEVISGCRPGARVRGSGRVSLHASCKAADITMKNYPCAYPILAKTPCGYSTDPGRVRHIHVSCSPGTREYGRHFAHWSPGHRRYARRHGRHLVRV